MLTDFLPQLLFERNPQCAGFGKSRRDEDGCWDLFRGAVVDDSEDCVGRHSDDRKIDRAWNRSQRGKDWKPCNLGCMGIDRDDRSCKAAFLQRFE